MLNHFWNGWPQGIIILKHIHTLYIISIRNSVLEIFRLLFRLIISSKKFLMVIVTEISIES